jgi:short-subunit dehydrogenase
MANDKYFTGRVVVITGASAGIGRAIATAFMKAGAHLGLISRNAERLSTLKAEAERYSIKTMIFPIDVSDADAMQDAAEKVEKELGPIDIWINNAMVSVFAPVLKMTAEEYKRVTEVTYLGTVYGTMAALKRMAARNKGVIIQVGSALAYRGIPLQSAYCAAKHAIQGFHDSLLSELIHDNSNVKVTMVQLSAHNTPQFEWVRSKLRHRAQPVPPVFQPEVAAKAVMWAATHYRREYVVGFPAWKAIYGNNFFPAWGDRYLAKRGYDSQQTEDVVEEHPDNLFNSVPGQYGAHGRFDDVARETDLFFEVAKYIPFTVIIMAIVLAVLLIFVIIL